MIAFQKKPAARGEANFELKEWSNGWRMPWRWWLGQPDDGKKNRRRYRAGDESGGTEGSNALGKLTLTYFETRPGKPRFQTGRRTFRRADFDLPISVAAEQVAKPMKTGAFLFFPGSGRRVRGRLKRMLVIGFRLPKFPPTTQRTERFRADLHIFSSFSARENPSLMPRDSGRAIDPLREHFACQSGRVKT